MHLLKSYVSRNDFVTSFMLSSDDKHDRCHREQSCFPCRSSCSAGDWQIVFTMLTVDIYRQEKKHRRLTFG
jgi:hypothetical protein